MITLDQSEASIHRDAGHWVCGVLQFSIFYRDAYKNMRKLTNSHLDKAKCEHKEFALNHTYRAEALLLIPAIYL